MKVYISPSSQEHNDVSGYNEEVVQNEIADILIPELIRHGIEVMRNSRENTFREHIIESNAYQPDFHVAMHSNASAASSSHTARGCSVYCFDPLDRNNQGTLLAEYLHNFFMEIPVVRDRGLASGKLTLSEISKTNAPAVLVEIDFHDNVEGARWIIDYKKQIANAYLMGILTAFKISYTPVIATPIFLYRVQVGSFHNYSYAKNMVDNLTKDGYFPYIKKEVEL